MIKKINIEFHKYNTIIVGSGAAGLNAAVMLYSQGQQNIAIITEGINMGTSRNTGSDKQTYYKLSLSGDTPDSIRAMADTLFSGGCVDGDIALAEAANSVRAFFHLVDLGVPFPTNEMGEYIGYKTDHDPARRGTSVGPYTSKCITEALENQVRQNNIKIYDGYLATRLFIKNEEAKGIFCINKKKLNNEQNRYAIFSATNIIWATGGEAGMYQASVYPASQTGGMAPLLKAGAIAKNLTESQYGIASIKFRWNLSGSYQQCIPKYLSTDKDGNNPREFLDDYFSSPQALIQAIFLKGYQWPFDPQKATNEGSSLIDILVYQESILKGRRVFLDFRQNPSALYKNGKADFTLLSEEARDYLKNCDALYDSPIERLKAINPAAISVYRDHNIDLRYELLEIAVCAQHNNGGIEGNCWWESNIKHLFPIGEVNGSHGVFRPGGTALNSGQVGGIRASQYIIHKYFDDPISQNQFFGNFSDDINEEVQSYESALSRNNNNQELQALLKKLQTTMTQYGSFIRSEQGCKQALKINRQLHTKILTTGVNRPEDLILYSKLKGLCFTQYVYLNAILDYIQKVGISRGSYLVFDENGKLPCKGLNEIFRNTVKPTDVSVLQEVQYCNTLGTCSIIWRRVRIIPKSEQWFEKAWKNCRTGKIYSSKSKE